MLAFSLRARAHVGEMQAVPVAKDDVDAAEGARESESMRELPGQILADEHPAEPLPERGAVSETKDDEDAPEEASESVRELHERSQALLRRLDS